MLGKIILAMDELDNINYERCFCSLLFYSFLTEQTENNSLYIALDDLFLVELLPPCNKNSLE